MKFHTSLEGNGRRNHRKNDKTAVKVVGFVASNCKDGKENRKSNSIDKDVGLVEELSMDTKIAQNVELGFLRRYMSGSSWWVNGSPIRPKTERLEIRPPLPLLLFFFFFQKIFPFNLIGPSPSSWIGPLIFA